jgi:hypothetical protein
MYNVGAGSGNLGAKTGFVFMGTSVVLLVLAWVYIPETRGLSTEVIDGLYEGGVKPRRSGSVESRLSFWFSASLSQVCWDNSLPVPLSDFGRKDWCRRRYEQICIISHYCQQRSHCQVLLTQ